MKPDLTFFSDASVMPLKEANGWAFWIKGDGRKAMYAGGPLKNYTPQASIAELEAMANGLHCARVSGYFKDLDRSIMLQSDSVEALACILHCRPDTRISPHATSAHVSTRKRELCDKRASAVMAILNILDGHALMPIIRHVRAHREGNGRNYVNNLCDRLAKQGARQAA